MTTSKYTDVQSQILIAVSILRRLPLAEFIATAKAVGNQSPLDYMGIRVAGDPQLMVVLAEHAQQMVDSFQPGVRKPVKAETESLVTKVLAG